MALLSQAARGRIVFYDSFDLHPTAKNLNNVADQIGFYNYTVTGGALLPTLAVNGDQVADAGSVDATKSIALFGPAVGGERWLRYDFRGRGGTSVVLIPQLVSGTETSAAGLPTIVPAGQSGNPWSVTLTSFGSGQRGTVSAAQVNLATLYPTWDDTQPYHLEAHWKVTSATTADLEMRAWNGFQPPVYAAGSRVTYTLSSGIWSTSSRSAIAGSAPGGGLVTAMAEYDAPPSYPNIIPATNANISYSGRWVPMGAGEMHTPNAGGHLRFLVTGGCCYLRIRGTGYVSGAPAFSYRIDGGPWTRVTQTSATETVVRVYDGDQSWGPHLVDVVVSEVWLSNAFSEPYSRFMFEGLGIDDEGSVTPVPFPSHKVVFYGDSMMDGFGALNGFVGPRIADQSDATLSMPFVIADWLGIDAIDAAVVGLGYFQTGDSTGVDAATSFLYVLQGVPWDPDWTPDAIVINLGVRDTESTCTDEQLEAAVVSTLTAVRSKFPASHIFVLKPLGGTREAALETGFAEWHDSNEEWVDTTGWLDMFPGHDTTQFSHPSLYGNYKYATHMATLLSTFFSSSSEAPALITPAADATVSGMVNVTGTAEGAGFTGYTVDAGDGNAPKVWTPVASSTVPTHNAPLGEWNTTNLTAGPHTLRLIVMAGSKGQVVTRHVTVQVIGDLNGDGAVTTADVVAAVRAASGLDVTSSQTEAAGDVSPGAAGHFGDGRIDLTDAISIARRAAGLAPEWP